MFDLDKFEIEIPCPRCGFDEPATIKQVRLDDVVICRSCKRNLPRVVCNRKTIFLLEIDLFPRAEPASKRKLPNAMDITDNAGRRRALETPMRSEYDFSSPARARTPIDSSARSPFPFLGAPAPDASAHENRY